MTPASASAALFAMATPGAIRIGGVMNTGFAGAAPAAPDLGPAYREHIVDHPGPSFTATASTTRSSGSTV